MKYDNGYKEETKGNHSAKFPKQLILEDSSDNVMSVGGKSGSGSGTVKHCDMKSSGRSSSSKSGG